MDKIKINLDREKLSSEYIHSKQDFKQVQNQVSTMHTSIFKSTWFFGTVGIASVAALVMITFNNSNSKQNDTNSTLSQTTILHSKQEALADASSVNAFSASEEVPEKLKTEQVSIKKTTAPKVNKTIVLEKNIDNIASVPESKESMKIISTPSKEIVKSSTAEKINYYPKISGVYNGEISQSKLCEAGIEVNNLVNVTNFTLYYSTNRGDKTTVIKGNRLPENICQEMKQYGIDQMIFITDIVGKDENGKIYNFTSMNLTALID